MKFNRIPALIRNTILQLVPLLLFAIPTFANSVIAGGYVPEIRRLTVIPTGLDRFSGEAGAVAVAEIEIDNNLPDYQLVLEFHSAVGEGDVIETVRLESLGGILGRGLTDPSDHPLEADAGTGRYVWNPGRQETATLGYRVRVMVTYKRPVTDMTPMTVSMRFPY